MRLFIGILCAVLLLGGLVFMAGLSTGWNWIEALTAIGVVMGTMMLIIGLIIGIEWGFRRE